VLSPEGLAALGVLLVILTLLAAAALVLPGGWQARAVWELWRDAMLWVLTLGSRGRWPL
jgi:hypothetical protein